ncbi:MAG: VWA domain-containing protein [Planctomycetia bacterium]|nr:VWA domain-containing protein [Planctomycetia bacterium]
MFGYDIAFDNHWYLLLALALPVLWVASWRNLSGLGPVRRWLALALRTIVALLVICALAEMQLLRTSDRMTVVYLLDQSESIPRASRKAMINYCKQAVAEHRNKIARDRVAVIVFGREPAVEVGLTDGDLPLPEEIESRVDAEFSNVEAAMNMAKAMFPEDAAKRIVIISDGNENIGDARRGARGLSAGGVGIDVVAVRAGSSADVAVEKVTVPGDVRRGEPFKPRVVLNNTTPPLAGQTGVVKGRLRITRRTAEEEPIVRDLAVELPPGKTVISTVDPITLDHPDFYTFEARFVPDNPGDDAIEKNNRATAFTQVRGKGQVLLIEDVASRGQFDHVVEALREENLTVTRQSSDQLFGNLAELQRYDSVVLANVPRVGGEDTPGGVVGFSDDQISMLARNTQQLGCGLVMLGGPNSFGAGGWTNTEVEKALPVDMQISNMKVTVVGALMLVIDTSGSMAGEKIEVCKAASIAALRMLSSQDYLGVVGFDSDAHWIVPLVRNTTPGESARRIGQLGGGGGTNMMPGLTEAYQALRRVNSSVKHVIVLTDGMTDGSGYADLARQMRKAGITTTSVAVGDDADKGLLTDIAREGGGKFYFVRNLKTLPRIFMRETRRLATPLIFEQQDSPFAVKVTGGHELTQAISAPPPITGFVRTTVKESPLVEVSMRSTKPGEPTNSTILASWTYGLGRTVAFTTDSGETAQRWASRWKDWPDYRKFFSKMIRWSMRPINDTGRFLLATDVEEGRIKVVVSAWDEKDQFLNDLPITGTVVGPDMKIHTVTFEQTAPGRYVGQAEAGDSGSYLLAVHPGGGRAPLRSGLSVPYSAEYRERQANLTLLGDLAALKPTGGVAGKFVDNLAQPQAPAQLLAGDPFRRDLAPARSTQGIWHLLAFVTATLFLCDIGIRRIQFSFAWLPPLVAKARDRVLRRGRVEEATPTMARLQSLKAQVSDRIEQRRAAVRFEPTSSPTDGAADNVIDGIETEAPKPAPKPKQGLTPQAEAEDNSYTNRLLKAKKQVRDQRR